MMRKFLLMWSWCAVCLLSMLALLGLFALAVSLAKQVVLWL